MIAISYRRQDSSAVAGRLYDRLQTEFGTEKVFMDFDSIPYGVDFREHIKQALLKAKVVVAIIGPEWSGGKGIGRRIDDPADFVRLEIAGALQYGIPIIPVLLDETPMPSAKTLPPEIEGLAFRNGLVLDTGIDFHHHANRLIAGIHKVVDSPQVPPPATLPPKAPHQKLTLVAAIGILAVLLVATWYFIVRDSSKMLVRQTPVESVRKSESVAPVSNPTPPKVRPDADKAQITPLPTASPPTPPPSGVTSSADIKTAPQKNVQTAAAPPFKVHNNTKEKIIKLLVSEDGKTYGFFDIGDGIKPGETETVSWDKSTNGQLCHQWFKAVWASGVEGKPVKFDFCEKDLKLEF